MQFDELLQIAQAHPKTSLRFVLPNGDSIPPHAHLTEVGHVVKTFIDCGGVTGREEKIVLQTHVGDDTDHQLQADRFAKILELGARVIPDSQLEVDVEYDCCVVSQYPIASVNAQGDALEVTLRPGRTQCRARERREAESTSSCCNPSSACCS
jgi:hypothetical protein